MAGLPPEEGKGGNLATSSTAAKAEEAAAAGGSATPAAADGAEEEVARRKTRTVRMTQAQVDRVLAYTPRQLPAVRLSGVPERLRGLVTEALADAARALRESQEDWAAEQERVRREVAEKGYAEVEVDEDDADGGAGSEDDGEKEERVVVPRPGRRRYRPGVKKDAGGGVKRVN
ncbi:hypothetical protein ACP70R_008009 [Stipagrostis hirtigluma subsp. patula]